MIELMDAYQLGLSRDRVHKCAFTYSAILAWASCSTFLTELPIVRVYFALSQGCAVGGCDLRACGPTAIPYKTVGRARGFSLRVAVQSRASDAHCDKAGPNLFGMPLRQAQVESESLQAQAPLASSTQPQQSLSGPLDALRAHGTTLKHVAAGMAISAALFAGESPIPPSQLRL